MAIVALLLVGCGSAKEVPYMIDASNLPQNVLNNAAKSMEQPLLPGDLIQINVSCSQPDLVKMFNKTEIIGSTNTLNNNNEYYKVQNSWDTNQVYDGYFYVSKAFFRAKTMDIYLNKAGVPAKIGKKIGL